MNHRLLIIITIICCSISCAPFEDEKFFEPVKTNTYQYEQYTGPHFFDLGEDDRIPIDKRTEITLESDNGISLVDVNAVFVGNVDDIPTTHIILYCHDKNHNIDFYWERIQLLAKLGLDAYGILIIDYRGYGKSNGSTDEFSLIADVDAGIRWLQEKGLTEDRLTLYGYGLGAAPAISLTTQPRSLSPSRIILESPFASMESLIQSSTNLAIPGNYLSDLKFDNATKIKNMIQPLLWIHGDKNETYPLDSQGEVVFKHHPGIENEKKFALRIANANHYDTPLQFPLGLDGYVLEIATFLSKTQN